MRFHFPVVALALMTSGLLASACQAGILSEHGFQFYGDFRARIEADFDSLRSDGTERDDRDRLRIRARLGLNYTPNDHLSFGLRLRSGSDDSHQSPHITLYDFDDNDRGDAHFNVDRWYAKVQGERTWAWIGRNNPPFFKQHELFLDDDVTPVGLALGWKTGIGDEGSFTANAGYFSPPVGMQDFSGHLGIGQLVFQSGGLTAAGGLLAFDADTTDSDAPRLLRGNGLRDYTIWVGSLQWKTTLSGRPLALGGDVLHNSESYSAIDPNPFTAQNRDQTDGYVLSAKFGASKEQGDWMVACFFARLEAFAVNASFSEDDWMRWGSATENRSSDFEGYELRFDYALQKNQNLVFRFYHVEAITSQEDGSRFRVDFDYRF